jgi:hypothetical protein
VDSETGQAAADPRPRLWNPRAAGAWGFLLSPPVGALLHAANWRALGRPDRAAVSMGWFWCVGVLQVGVAVASLYVPFPEFVATWWPTLGFTILAFWAKHAESQARYVKETLKNDYIRRPWGAPLIVGSALAAALYLVPLNFPCALYVPDASVITAEMRPLLLKEWRKNEATREAKITGITLVRKDGREYTGFVEATFGNEPAKLTLDVVYDSGTLLFTARPIEK